MIRDYQIASPSLEGVLSHDSLLYEGLKRPLELLKALDGPSTKGRKPEGKSCSDREINIIDEKTLETYFYDLYGVFMKRLSHFIVEADLVSDENVKLQAMLQEMIKVKTLMMTGRADQKDKL